MDRETLRAYRTWGFDRRGWRETTRYRYGQALISADEWLRAEHDKPLSRANEDDIAAYMSTLPATPSTRNVNRQALSAYFRFLIQRGSRANDPTDPYPRLKTSRSIPKALAPDEAQQVMKAAESEGPRWEMAVAVMLYAGLRATECRQMQWIDMKDGWLHVEGKGGHERNVPLHDRIGEAAGRWRPSCPSAGWVFPSPIDHNDTMSHSWLWRTVKNIGHNAAVEGLHPHQCRHTFATRLVEQGADLRTVQELMGHQELSTTAIYTKVRPLGLRSAVDRLDYRATG